MKRRPIRIAVDPPIFSFGELFTVEFEAGNGDGIRTCHDLTREEIIQLRDGCNEALVEHDRAGPAS